MRYRCGALIPNPEDRRRRYPTCRIFVATEGARCRHHPKEEDKKDD